jgi:hypothetical protein
MTVLPSTQPRRDGPSVGVHLLLELAQARIRWLAADRS